MKKGKKVDILTVKGLMVSCFILHDTASGNAIIIDTGTRNMCKKVLKTLDKSRIPHTKVKALLITHAHSDHCGGARYLSETIDIPVICHEKARSPLESGHDVPENPLSPSAKLLSKMIPGRFEPVTPSKTVRSSMDLSRFGVNAKIIHTPGHTPGSISIMTAETAIIGDLLMSRRDRPRYPLFGDKEEIHTSTKKLLNKGIRWMIPSHGSPFSDTRVRHFLQASGPK